MTQATDSDGNLRCVMCGQIMRPYVGIIDGIAVMGTWHIGYRNSGLFCTKSCGYNYGLRAAMEDYRDDIVAREKGGSHEGR